MCSADLSGEPWEKSCPLRLGLRRIAILDVAEPADGLRQSRDRRAGLDRGRRERRFDTIEIAMESAQVSLFPTALRKIAEWIERGPRSPFAPASSLKARIIQGPKLDLRGVPSLPVRPNDRRREMNSSRSKLSNWASRFV